MAENVEKPAIVQIKIREGEYALLLRLRQFRNQAGEKGRYRIELEIGENEIEILTQQKITREAFILNG